MLFEVNFQNSPFVTKIIQIESDNTVYLKRKLLYIMRTEGWIEAHITSDELEKPLRIKTSASIKL